jgi:hypothetical protein
MDPDAMKVVLYRLDTHVSTAVDTKAIIQDIVRNGVYCAVSGKVV